MQDNIGIKFKIDLKRKIGFRDIFFTAGGVVGLGFGIFSSIKNFDPDNHQSHDMNASTRYFSELLTQIGMAELHALGLGVMGWTLGFIIDKYTNEKYSRIISNETDVSLSDVQPDIRTHLLTTHRPTQR